MTEAAQVEAAGIPWLEVFALAAAITVVTLVGTARWWLAALLGWLDRVLARLGVGTWAARFLTWAERKASGVFPQGARRGDTGGEESDR
jgi:hypothetical protein